MVPKKGHPIPGIIKISHLASFPCASQSVCPQRNGSASLNIRGQLRRKDIPRHYKIPLRLHLCNKVIQQVQIKAIAENLVPFMLERIIL